MAVLFYEEGVITEVKGLWDESGVELNNLDKDKFLGDRSFVH